MQESRGGDCPVPVRTVRQELGVGDGVDDGGREADEGRITGVGSRDVVPEEKESWTSAAKLDYGDDEGHGETDAPEGHGPVTYGPSPKAHVSHSEEGPQVEKKSCGRRKQQNTQQMTSSSGYVLWVDMVF